MAAKVLFFAILGIFVISCTHSFTLLPTTKSSSCTLQMKAMRFPGVQKQNIMGFILSPFLWRLGFGGLRSRRGGAVVGVGGGGRKRSTSTRRRASQVYDEATYSNGHTTSDLLQELEATSPPGVVPVIIRYTGGVGFKSIYSGVVKILRENFKDRITIRKTILATGSGSSRKTGQFEVQIGEVVFGKRGEGGSPGVYLPMDDIKLAIDKALARREKEKDTNGGVAVSNE